jgi:hypothetical protein
VRYQINTFAIAKRGRPVTKTQDAWWPMGKRVIETNQLSVCLADGVTHSHRPELFNRPLCRAVCKQQYLGDLRERQVQRVCRAYRRLSRTPAATWLDTHAQQAGAATTLLHLSLMDGTYKLPSDYWCATAVGDTCLFFHDQRKDQVNVLPFTSSAQFDNHPEQIRCDFDRVPACQDAWRSHAGTHFWGDQFLLATDAIAKFLIQQTERGRQLVPTICRMIANDQFDRLDTWVRGKVHHGEIDDDDITLMLVRVLRG